MKTSKTTAIGFLLCLCALYMMSGAWSKDQVLAVLPVLGAYTFPVGVVVALTGLFRKD